MIFTLSNKKVILRFVCNIFQVKEKIQPVSCLDNYGVDLGSTDSVFYASHSSCTSDEPEVKDEPLENCTSMLQISDTIENSLRVLYPVLFFIFNLFYWWTYTQ